MIIINLNKLLFRNSYTYRLITWLSIRYFRHLFATISMQLRCQINYPKIIQLVVNKTCQRLQHYENGAIHLEICFQIPGQALLRYAGNMDNACKEYGGNLAKNSTISVGFCRELCYIDLFFVPKITAQKSYKSQTISDVF